MVCISMIKATTEIHQGTNTSALQPPSPIPTCEGIESIWGVDTSEDEVLQLKSYSLFLCKVPVKLLCHL